MESIHQVFLVFLTIFINTYRRIMGKGKRDYSKHIKPITGSDEVVKYLKKIRQQKERQKLQEKGMTDLQARVQAKPIHKSKPVILKPVIPEGSLRIPTLTKPVEFLRRKVKGMIQSFTMSFRIDLTTKKIIKEISIRDKTSMAEIIRRSLWIYIAVRSKFM